MAGSFVSMVHFAAMLKKKLCQCERKGEKEGRGCSSAGRVLILQALHLKSLKSVDYCHNLEGKCSETHNCSYHFLKFFLSDSASDLGKLTKSLVLYSGHKGLWHFSLGHRDYPSVPTLFKF